MPEETRFNELPESSQELIKARRLLQIRHEIVRLSSLKDAAAKLGPHYSDLVTKYQDSIQNLNTEKQRLEAE
jgi:hypothetical protein